MKSKIQRITRDTNRFKKIVRGKVRKNLKKYISNGEFIGKQGKDVVSIPLPQIDIPRFKFNDRQMGGVGQGEGDVGDALAPGEGKEGKGKAGNMPGEHPLEVDVTIEELADILGEELGLPNIQEKGKSNITNTKNKYTGINKTGPESLRNFRRTFKQALKRQIASGTYNYKDPRIIPIKDDKRYRTWKVYDLPDTKAVIIYMMDVSGSMGEDQKEIVRIESFWIDAWLRKQYDGIEVRYIIHDATAKEVDRETFFHTKESGGTMISSAYKLCSEIMQKDYPFSEWNVYPFHFSDGDNWSGDDSEVCMRVLKQDIFPSSNVFCYGQVYSPYGSGKFLKELHKEFPQSDDLITSEIPDRESIVLSIKQFLGTGK